MTVKPKTIEVHGYTIRKFTIAEYADLAEKCSGILPLLESLEGEENQLESLGKLVTKALPQMILAVSYATDKDIEEIKKIDDMDMFIDILLGVKQVNDFLVLKAAVQRLFSNLFQQGN